MDKVKRNERIAVITNTISSKPGKIFTLSYFSSILNAPKSSLSEDITIIKEAVAKSGIGRVDTIPGAAGGVRFLPVPDFSKIYSSIAELSNILTDSRRALNGGYIYMTDILSNPSHLQTMANGLVYPFLNKQIDFVLTLETKGIPIALTVARTLGVPLIIARRENRINEGTLVTINYLSGTGKTMQTMSLPRRSITTGSRALIIDDFMKGGGSIKGLCDLMKEFNVTVAGIAVVIATKTPDRKLITKYHSLLTLNNVDEYQGIIDIKPSRWFLQNNS